MAAAVPSPTRNISLSPGTTFIARKNNILTRSTILRKFNKQTVAVPKYILPLATSVRLFPQLRIGYNVQTKLRTHIASATETDVVVEKADSVTTEANSGDVVETALDAGEKSEESTAKSDASPTSVPSKRSRPARKSEMPPVKNEELIPGASFTGKVRSIQTFGAFVDFGAFTDGLVHVSRLSDDFVKDVSTVVSVGQEVTVRLVEANFETGRISLTMRDENKRQQKRQQDASSPSDKSRPSGKSSQRNTQKREQEKKTSKFVIGQDLQGTVKNLARSGAFISLPEGEDGFLPISEEAADGFGNVMGETSLEVGQEVNVRVLRISRGQVTLTMKKEEDTGKLDSKLSQGVVHTATNPFVLAFRSNKDISAFLDEQDKDVETATTPKADVKGADTGLSTVDNDLPQSVVKDEGTRNVISDFSESEDSEVKSTEEVEEGSATLTSVESASTVDQTTEIPSPVDAAESNEEPESSVQVLSPENTVDEVTEKQADDVLVKDEVQTQTPNEEGEPPLASSGDEEKGVPEPEGNDSIECSTGQTGISSNTEGGIAENEVAEEAIENQVDNSAQMEEKPTETPAADSEVPSGQNALQEESPTKAISPALVKQLREETGAGMMDCKKALSEAGGDLVKAHEYLRKKGLASAEKKASRTTAEGRVGSYVHDSRIGVLIEVNCETDFVSRGDIFKELVNDLAMQVAACPQVEYLVPEDVSQEIVDKEREIEMQREDLLSKPEQIRSKIVDGRVRKRLEELALLEQLYIKNDKIAVKDWVKQTIATIGENIKVKRFVRYNLGEGLEKKSQDFAAEVAAQTAVKSTPAPVKEQTAAEAQEPVAETPKATVSAALVKQLREETGAGMMDCKKALSETGGDLEKAHEYLRKKGLSSAEKKSSRLAAEGRIGSYIHDSRIGVLIEVNCETDFVARNENFKELVDDLAMQVVACPQVRYVSIEDIPESIVNKEKELEMQREDLQSKPENIREKIVEGRLSKRLGELALLEQPFIKDDSVLIKDLVKQNVAALGENIKVRRFVRFTLGEDGNAA